jgi:signal transduction histidine kinase
VDLALLALLAEQAYLAGVPDTAPLSDTQAAFVPRLGDYLVQQGILTTGQLEEALVHQKVLAKQGERRLLGQTLVELEMVDRETIDRAITSQIIELHAALQDANRNLEQKVSDRTAELRQALGRLQELNTLKTNLISNVSHELRTPLAHVKGYVELLEEQELGELSPEQAKAVSVISRATLRLEHLIEDLIAFSTASREGVVLDLRPAQLAQVAEGVIARSKDKAAMAGVKLQLAVDRELPYIQADLDKLSWVLYQLVDNAIKFTPEGGRVKLWAEHVNRMVTVAVSDTGIGIPSDKLEEIFEPFHQLDGSPTRRRGGTGLGLSMVRQIVGAHGANVVVESVEKSGSTFRFDLPLAAEQA